MRCEWCDGEFEPQHKNDKRHSDIYDCCDVLDPQWMMKWMKRIIEKEKIKTESDFVKWSKKYSS